MSQKSMTTVFSVSVIIPAYNAQKHIKRAIDCVLAQTLKPDEIIIVDDGSKDDTANIVKRYGDKVRYVYQENAGPSAARNTGIEAACSKWVAFLDGDDEWAEDKLELQVDILKSNPDLVWVSGNYYRCLCEKKIIRHQTEPSIIDRLLDGKEYFENFFTVFQKDIYGNTDTMLVRKDVLVEAGMFPVGIHRAEDMYLWWQIALRYPEIGFVSDALATYHLEVGSSVSVTEKSWEFHAQMLAKSIESAQLLGKSDILKPTASMMLRRWIRAMLFDGEAEPVRCLLDSSRELVTPGYRLFIRTLITFPKLTAFGCRLMSKIVRALGIRKTLIRAPK